MSELEFAVNVNDLNQIKEFIANGGNIYREFTRECSYFLPETAMANACREQKTEIVEILLDVYERDYKIAEECVSNEKNKDFLLKYILIASSNDEVNEVINLSKKSQSNSKKSLVFLADRQECILVAIVDDKDLMFKLHKNGLLTINCRAQNGENPGHLVGAMNRLDLLKRMVAIGLNYKDLIPGTVESVYVHNFIERIIVKSSSMELIKYCLNELKLDHVDLLQLILTHQSIEVFEYVLEYLSSRVGSSKRDYIQAYCRENAMFNENTRNLSNNLVAHMLTVYYVKLPLKSNFFTWFFEDPISSDYITKILEIEKDNFDILLDSIGIDTDSTVIESIWNALDKNTLKNINKNNVKIIILSQTKEYFDMIDPLAIYDEEKGNTAVFIALEHNCSLLIRHLISKGADLVHKNQEGHTTLTAACKYCSPEMIDLVMKSAPSLINEVGANEYYPLTELVYRGDSLINVFNEMLKRGANFHVQDSNNDTLLHHAIKARLLHHTVSHLNIEFVKRCLDLGIDPSIQGSKGNTALHLSVILNESIQQNFKIFDLILDTGKVDTEIKNDFGNTVLHNVCETSDDHFFVSFVKKTKPNVNAVNNAGQTPLYYCFNQLRLRKLLQMGADTNIVGNNNLPFYTYLAESEWKSDVFDEIFYHSDIDLTITADDGTTLLHWLPYVLDMEIDDYFKNENFKELFRKCTNTLSNNCSAFHCAAIGSNVDFVKYMFEYAEPDLDRKNNYGVTPIFENLSDNFHRDMLEYLIEKGADVNVQNDLGNSLIFESVFVEGTEILLKAGASVKVINKKGQSALHLAALRNELDICLLLLKYGADLNIEDENGQKPTDVCTYGFVKDLLNFIAE